MTSPYKVDILLSTYDGESYLRELLESLLFQSFTDWRLIIRDDGSTDKTVEILNEYSFKYLKKIIVIPSFETHLGPKGSFNKLMEASSAPFVMFCDQDDIWLPDKIERSINQMIDLEKRFGPESPALVYMNYSLVDEKGAVIAADAWKYLKIQPEKGELFRNIILRNIFIGHTMLMNRSLVQLAVPIPPESIMHDWWLGLVASAFGRTGHIIEPSVLYRQHQKNLLGLKKVGLFDSFLKCTFSYQKYVDLQRGILSQGRAFFRRFEGLLKKRDRKFNYSQDIEDVAKFMSMDKMGFLEKKLFLIRFYKEFPYKDKAFIDILWY